MTRVSWDAIAPDYHRHRRLAPEGLAAWREAVRPFAPGPDAAPLLDLGAGTGQFAALFADWFGSRVLALEPSAGMRAEGRRLAAHPRVSWVGAGAPALPLADASCHGAWLSTVIHHLPDLDGSARALRRAVRPGGAVLIRNAFPGRQRQISLFRWFPGAGRVVDGFPSVERVVGAFEAHGFRLEALEALPQTSAPGLRAFAERVRLRADSTLRRMDDGEFARDLARLERAAAREEVPAPVVDWLDLMVLV